MDPVVQEYLKEFAEAIKAIAVEHGDTVTDAALTALLASVLVPGIGAGILFVVSLLVSLYLYFMFVKYTKIDPDTAAGLFFASVVPTIFVIISGSYTIENLIWAILAWDNPLVIAVGKALGSI